MCVEDTSIFTVKNLFGIAADSMNNDKIDHAIVFFYTVYGIFAFINPALNFHEKSLQAFCQTFCPFGNFCFIGRGIPFQFQAFGSQNRLNFLQMFFNIIHSAAKILEGSIA